MFLLTSVVAGTVDCGVILFLVPPRILFLTRKRRAHFCHPTGVLAAFAGVHSAPVQPRTSEEGRKEECVHNNKQKRSTTQTKVI